MLDLFEYEVAVDGGGEAPAPVEPAAEPAAADPVAAEPITGADPGDEQPQFDEAAFQQWLDGEVDARVAARFSAQQQHDPPIAGATPGPMNFDWSQVDPYGEDYGPNLGNGVRTEVQQALAPILGAFQQMTNVMQSQQEAQEMERGQQYAQDMLADDIARNGDLTDTGKTQALALAEAFMPQAQQRYGLTARAAEQAIAQAAHTIRQIQKEAADQAVTQNQNRLATLAGQPQEPGTSGVAAVVPGESQKYASSQGVAAELLSRYSG